ncbi:hypothetical protein CPB83DRAFT_774638 [Crepidotus variabilis]|uniref:Uncharacterized protein n=1 Tax=Crepidotus variabilis TaxID=179855 RepID=A0A9P6E7L3_9AGAR|nr:hypothetical protein CPB83DRAFT_774638 [Crepidotus variabilis]
MVDWKSADVVQASAVTGVHIIHLLSGVYFYDFIANLGFDYDFIAQKRKFKWPLIFYFANRYFMLGFYIVANHRVNCRLIYVFLKVFADFSRAFASISFALRTIAVWARNPFIIAALCLMILAQWAIIISTGIWVLKIDWISGVGCVPGADNTWFWLTMIFVYSMCFDFTVLVLNAYKLRPPFFRTSGMRSSLVSLVFHQGLVFYIISLTGDLIAIVFLALNLNAALDSVFATPSELISTLVACRAVRTLTNVNDESGNDATQVFFVQASPTPTDLPN